MPSSPASSEQGPHASGQPEPDAAAAAPASDELTDELARIEDRYKRALADLDNYRKRSAREIEHRVAEARESMLRDWLDAVDSVERAMRMDPTPSCRDGTAGGAGPDVRRSSRVRGLHRIGAIGEGFDPERHEAIAVQPADDVPDRTIVAVRPVGVRVGRSRDPPGAGRGRSRARARALMSVAYPGLLRGARSPARRQRRGHPPGLPQARAPVAPRRQQGGRAPRTASRRSPRPTRSCAIPRSERRYDRLRSQLAEPARTPPARAASTKASAPATGFRDCSACDFGGGGFSDFFERRVRAGAPGRAGGAASKGSRCAAPTMRPCSS